MTDFDFPVKTTFASIPIPASANVKGIAIGQGECLGVRLYLNTLVLNTQTQTETAANLAQVYYGDSQTQRRELLAGVESRFLPCTDLEQIFVRCNGVANEVQIIIYTRAN